jgi:hypothetical protein
MSFIEFKNSKNNARIAINPALVSAVTMVIDGSIQQGYNTCIYVGSIGQLVTDDFDTVLAKLNGTYIEPENDLLTYGKPGPAKTTVKKPVAIKKKAKAKRR